jgi:hypothetical protein
LGCEGEVLLNAVRLNRKKIMEGTVGAVRGRKNLEEKLEKEKNVASKPQQSAGADIRGHTSQPHVFSPVGAIRSSDPPGKKSLFNHPPQKIAFREVAD